MRHFRHAGNAGKDRMTELGEQTADVWGAFNTVAAPAAHNREGAALSPNGTERLLLGTTWITGYSCCLGLGKSEALKLYS